MLLVSRGGFGEHKVENGQSRKLLDLPSPEQVQHGKRKAKTLHRISARTKHSLEDAHSIAAPPGEATPWHMLT